MVCISWKLYSGAETGLECEHYNMECRHPQQCLNHCAKCLPLYRLFLPLNELWDLGMTLTMGLSFLSGKIGHRLDSNHFNKYLLNTHSVVKPEEYYLS